MPEAVKYEARQHVPLPLGEVTLDWQVIDNFEKSKGLDKLTGDAKKEVQNKIGQYVFNMADSFLGAGKTYQQILDTIPLDKLNTVFENAYNFATLDEKVNKAKEEGTAEAQVNSGIIGSLPSSSPNNEATTLSAEERAIAKKQGVTDEKYLQRKKEIEERNKKPEAIW